MYSMRQLSLICSTALQGQRTEQGLLGHCGHCLLLLNAHTELSKYLTVISHEEFVSVTQKKSVKGKKCVWE